jgi:ferredoxin-NADP reductase
MNPPPQTIRRPYRVVSNTKIAKSVLQLTLEPVDPKNFVVHAEAGQWVSLHLLNEDGSVWAKRSYSIALAPADIGHDKRIELGIKVIGDFTKRVKTLKKGDIVELQGPFGVFTLKDSPRSVFFAGGIGITPLRSMIRHAKHVYPDMDMILFYSVRDIEESAYGKEFEKMESDSFKLITQSPCVVDPDASGGFGDVDPGLVDGAVSDYTNTEFYLCGPVDYMDKITKFLGTRDVPNERIQVERFS